MIFFHSCESLAEDLNTKVESRSLPGAGLVAMPVSPPLLPFPGCQ